MLLVTNNLVHKHSTLYAITSSPHYGQTQVHYHVHLFLYSLYGGGWGEGGGEGEIKRIAWEIKRIAWEIKSILIRIFPLPPTKECWEHAPPQWKFEIGYQNVKNESMH